MKFISKIFTLILALCIVFTAVACKGERPDDDDDNGGAAGLPSIDNPWWSDSGTIEKDGDGNIVFDDIQIKLTSVICGYDQKGFEDMLEQFNREHRGQITVTHQTYNQLEIDDIVKRQIQNETNAPDLILTHQKTHANFVDNKLFQPMDSAYELAGLTLDKSNFLPNFADYCDMNYEGRAFTVPVDAQSKVIFYNKKMLKKYGDKLPESREEFISLCKRVQEGERKTNGNFYAITCGQDYEFFKMYLLPTAILQNGASLYESNGKVNWTSPENLSAFKKGIQAVQQWSKEGIWNSNDSSTDSISKFCSNNALFLVSLPFNANTIFSAYASANGHSVDVVKTQDIGGFSTAGLFAMDGAPEDAKMRVFGDSHAFAMSTTVTDVSKKAAIAVFCNWFTTNVNVGIEWAKLGHISASYTIRGNSVYNSNEFVNDFSNMFYGDINNFVTAGKTKNYSLIFPELQTTLLNCVKNNSNDYDIENALAQSQRKVNASIDLA